MQILGCILLALVRLTAKTCSPFRNAPQLIKSALACEHFVECKPQAVIRGIRLHACLKTCPYVCKHRRVAIAKVGAVT